MTKDELRKLLATAVELGEDVTELLYPLVRPAEDFQGKVLSVNISTDYASGDRIDRLYAYGEMLRQKTGAKTVLFLPADTKIEPLDVSKPIVFNVPMHYSDSDVEKFASWLKISGAENICITRSQGE